MVLSSTGHYQKVNGHWHGFLCEVDYVSLQLEHPLFGEVRFAKRWIFGFFCAKSFESDIDCRT